MTCCSFLLFLNSCSSCLLLLLYLHSLGVAFNPGNEGLLATCDRAGNVCLWEVSERLIWSDASIKKCSTNSLDTAMQAGGEGFVAGMTSRVKEGLASAASSSTAAGTVEGS